MSGSVPRVGRVGLSALRHRLSERDRQVLLHVASLRLLCARQIQALLFSPDQHASPATAARCCRRVLERLTRERLLVRLERRVGGARAGSVSFIYALGALGQRAIEDTRPRRRLSEPSERFIEHTLAIADFFICLHTQAKARSWELLEWQGEPQAWRQVATLGGRLMLRPDFFVVLAVGDYELRWFIEIDRGTEHLPAISQKCRLYQTYYKSGAEQRRHHVSPRVLWIVEDNQRAEQLQAAISGDRRLTVDLFQVATTDQAIDAIGATP